MHSNVNQDNKMGVPVPSLTGLVQIQLSVLEKIFNMYSLTYLPVLLTAAAYLNYFQKVSTQ